MTNRNLYIKSRPLLIENNAFIFTVKTNELSTGSSNNNQYKLPLISSFNGVTSYVDWGDGTSSVITNYNQSEVTHTYPSVGTYEIKITGAIRGWSQSQSGDRYKIRNISNWGIFNISNNAAFFGCAFLTVTANDLPIITTENLNSTFRSCTNLNYINLSNLDITTITNISSFFYQGDIRYIRGIETIDTSGINTLDGFFYRCSNFNQSLASWDIRNITSLASFLTLAVLDTVYYDDMLISWEGQVPKTNVNADFGNSKYTLGGSAAAARQSLITNYNWTIIDGGGI